VTVIWGDQDRSHRGTDPHSLRLGIPQAELVRFPDCGHFPDIEEPERCAALLLDRMGIVGP
jgi:pimeloyl-ACP methyl ester carboxylesterase